MNHISDIALWLLIAAISALFVGVLGSLFYSVYIHRQAGIDMPSAFYLSTVCILAASLAIERAAIFHRKESGGKYQNMLWVTLALSLAFLYFQIRGWLQLFNDQIGPDHSQVSGYLYLLSGMHLLHLVFGLPFLVWFIWTYRSYNDQDHRRALYFSDRKKTRTLDLLRRYWHFLDVLWVFLFVVFLVQELLLVDS